MTRPVPPPRTARPDEGALAGTHSLLASRVSRTHSARALDASGVRHSLDSMVAEAVDSWKYGVRSFIVFPKVAYNPDGCAMMQ